MPAPTKLDDELLFSVYEFRLTKDLESFMMTACDQLKSLEKVQWVLLKLENLVYPVSEF